MKTAEKKYEYDRQYAKDKLRQFKFTLNKDTDEKMIQWLESRKNKQGCIKDLIRAEMEREKAVFHAKP